MVAFVVFGSFCEEMAQIICLTDNVRDQLYVFTWKITAQFSGWSLFTSLDDKYMIVCINLG